MKLQIGRIIDKVQSELDVSLIKITYIIEATNIIFHIFDKIYFKSIAIRFYPDSIIKTLSKIL